MMQLIRVVLVALFFVGAWRRWRGSTVAIDYMLVLAWVLTVLYAIDGRAWIAVAWCHVATTCGFVRLRENPGRIVLSLNRKIEQMKGSK